MPGSVNENQTARYTINVAGKTVQQAEPLGLESVSVEDHVDMIGVCELTFGGGMGFDWSSVKVGDDVDMNFGGDTFKVFKGTITGLRHSYQAGRDSLTIMAMDPLCKLQASRKTKFFEDMTDSEIAEQVIGDSGAEAGQIDATTEKRPYMLQRNESNLEYIRRLAARNNFLVRAKEGKVDFVKAQYNNPPKEIKKKDIISLDYSFSPRALPQNTTVMGWDYKKKEMVQGTASSGDIQLIGGGTNSTSQAPIWQGEPHVSDVWLDSQTSAKDVAVAELNRMARNFLRGRAVIQGDGSLHVGVNVKFSEHRQGYNPEVYILSSRHRVFVGSGHTTEIQFCSNTYPDGGG